MSKAEPPKPLIDEELQTEMKAKVLRPLADKFQELTRQIDSGEYELPKTVQEASTITENYINQAWVRIEALIQFHTTALLDRVLEEAPKDQDESAAGLSAFGISTIRSNNAVNKQWRSLLNRAKEGKL